jgi:hypothetical protein
LLPSHHGLRLAQAAGATNPGSVRSYSWPGVAKLVGAFCGRLPSSLGLWRRSRHAYKRTLFIIKSAEVPISWRQPGPVLAWGQALARICAVSTRTGDKAHPARNEKNGRRCTYQAAMRTAAYALLLSHTVSYRQKYLYRPGEEDWERALCFDRRSSMDRTRRPGEGCANETGSTVRSLTLLVSCQFTRGCRRRFV